MTKTYDFYLLMTYVLGAVNIALAVTVIALVAFIISYKKLVARRVDAITLDRDINAKAWRAEHSDTELLRTQRSALMEERNNAVADYERAAAASLRANGFADYVISELNQTKIKNRHFDNIRAAYQKLQDANAANTKNGEATK